ncbi:pseudouridine synthase [Motilimonas eburnea]|uniref:pseudouridine synthase n=1 Tax=Motilimonas eburnea TaxID=1737488 RepID=UPI001E2EC0AE|nr:pseudouridine synthase [Motilimonas eburnea]MCE2570952.1 pseudouridine synthase [Motilimonas eburnea]
MRLARFIAQAGACSRRQASRHIEAGEVTINGRLARHIDQVAANDVVKLVGQTLQWRREFQYWLFNKPVGVDCNYRAHHSASLMHLIPVQAGRIFPVGRLDKDSHGLILLTDDGDLCQRLIHPDFYHPKTYHVRVARPFDEAFLASMAAGVPLRKGVTRACQIRRLAPDQFEIVLTQGLNRQIRKMAQALGHKVIDLQRVALVGIGLADLALGEWRQLTTKQVHRLKQQLTC